MKGTEKILDSLSELLTDMTVPRNVKARVENIIKTLKEKELSISVNEALHELDEIASDANLQQYTRTQLWNIISKLEKL